MRLCFRQPEMSWRGQVLLLVLAQCPGPLHDGKYHTVLSLSRPCLPPLQDPVFFEEKSMVLFISVFPAPSMSPSS